MPKFYFEDFSPGWTAEYGPRRVTREEMIGFAAQFDPQPMSLDEEAARGDHARRARRVGLAHLLR